MKLSIASLKKNVNLPDLEAARIRKTELEALDAFETLKRVSDKFVDHFKGLDEGEYDFARGDTGRVLCPNSYYATSRVDGFEMEAHLNFGQTGDLKNGTMKVDLNNRGPNSFDPHEWKGALLWGNLSYNKTATDGESWTHQENGMTHNYRLAPDGDTLTVLST